ncbi:hypothetical protein, partial [Corynebacterium diphtheriae]
MMVIVSCCVGGHCYFFPRQGMMATFDRANHLFFCQLQTMLCCLWWFFGQLVGLVPAKGLVDAFFV